MTHRPRKRFGQNFLTNQLVIDHILQAMHIQPSDHVVEIGPGLGALTIPLLKRLPKLTAIEIDKDLQVHLRAQQDAEEKLTLIDGDALTIDYGQFGNKLRIIGNLPYNISTPLLFHLLQFLPHIDDMLFMLQKEVVERMAAEPGHKTYGRLSVVLQYYCQVEHLFDVPASAFHPAPKVESAIVRLTPFKVSPYPAISFHEFEQFMMSAFSMRRKTLANNLKTILNASDLVALNIEPSLRPEQVSISDFVKIAAFVNDRTLRE